MSIDDLTARWGPEPAKGLKLTEANASRIMAFLAGEIALVGARAGMTDVWMTERAGWCWEASVLLDQPVVTLSGSSLEEQAKSVTDKFVAGYVADHLESLEHEAQADPPAVGTQLWLDLEVFRRVNEVLNHDPD